MNYNEWDILKSIAPIFLSMSSGCLIDMGMGRTTEILAEVSAAFNVNHYSVDSDHWICERYSPVHSKHTIYHGKTVAFLEQLKEPISFIFSDANHRYKYMQYEAPMVLEKLAPYGCYCIHDTTPMEGHYERKLQRKQHENDTYKIRLDLERLGVAYEVFTWPLGCGLTMVMKKKMDVPFYRR